MKTQILLASILTLYVTGCDPSITLIGEDSSNLAAIEWAADQYEEQFGVKVNVEAVSFGELQDYANTDLALGTGIYDIILQYNFSLSMYVDNEWVVPYEDFLTYSNLSEQDVTRIEGDVFPNVWRELGHFWNEATLEAQPIPVGLPFAANTMVLVYNKTLFEENALAFEKTYGQPLTVPETWPEFRNIAEFFTRPDDGIYGLSLQGADEGWLYYEWVNFAFSLGDGVMDKEYGWQGNSDTPLTISSTSTIDATQFYMDLKPFSDPALYFETSVIEQGQVMAENRAAMAIMWSDYLSSLIFPNGQNNKNRFGFAPIPGNKSMIAGGLFYINRSSNRKEAASKFIAYLLQEDIQTAMAARGLLPAFASAYTPANLESVPYLDAVKASLARGCYMNEAGPDADGISAILTEHLQRLWRSYDSTLPRDERRNLVKEALEDASSQLSAERREIYTALGCKSPPTWETFAAGKLEIERRGESRSDECPRYYVLRKLNNRKQIGFVTYSKNYCTD